MGVKAKYHLTKEKVKDLKADIENRRDYIGGSDIGVILGLNDFKSPYTLWSEKVGLVEPEDISDRDAVWLGTMTEEINGKRFCMKTGKRIYRSKVAYGIAEFPYLRGHVDFLVRNESAGLECKFSGYNKYKLDEGEIPPSHFSQSQFYMAVTGRKKWYLSTIQGNTYHVNSIERDDEFIERMLDACQDFWWHVQNGEPVPTDGSDSTTKTLSAMYPESLEGMSVDISEFETHLDALTELNEQKNSLSELQEKYKNEIKSALGEAERGETENYIVTWKSNVKGARVFKFKRKG